MTLSLRLVRADEAPRVLDFLRGMHAEVGRAPLVDSKATAAIAEVVRTGAAYIVEDDGEIVGSIGVTMFDFWYANATFLGELWLYVDPEYRASGEVLAMMLEEVREIADLAGQSVFLDHYRKPRGGAGLAIVADRLGFEPVSRILELSPGGR